MFCIVFCHTWVSPVKKNNVLLACPLRSTTGCKFPRETQDLVLAKKIKRWYVLDIIKKPQFFHVRPDWSEFFCAKYMSDDFGSFWHALTELCILQGMCWCAIPFFPAVLPFPALRFLCQGMPCQIKTVCPDRRFCLDKHIALCLCFFSTTILQ